MMIGDEAGKRHSRTSLGENLQSITGKVIDRPSTCDPERPARIALRDRADTPVAVLEDWSRLVA